MDPRIGTVDRLLEASGMGLEVMPRLGIGVDRTQVQRLLELPPGRRLELGVEGDRNVMGLVRQLRRVAE